MIARTASVAVLLCVVAATAARAAEETAWDRSVDAAAKERFIPVELWTGAAWDGRRDLRLTPADIRFGDRAQKEIKGPVQWMHPNTGDTISVYERTNQEKSGVKVEYFAMNEAKNGLGRVYDSRTELGPRTFTGGLKFPLGSWKQGETRQFTEKRYGGARIETRIEWITITKLDFTYNGTPHCLEFEWLYRDGGGKTVDHQT